MAQDATIHVRTDLYPLGEPLAGAYVGLHSAVGVFITSGVSSALGNVLFPALAAATYEIRVNPNAVGAVVTGGAVKAITVEDPVVTTNTFEVAVEVSTIPTASDSNLCRCSGYFVDPTGRPAKGVSLFFGESTFPQMLYQASTDTTSGVVPRRIVGRTDEDGHLVIDLIRNTEYSVIMAGYENIVRNVMVPDRSSVLIADVLYPVVGYVLYSDASVAVLPVDAPSVNLAIGETREILVTAYLRSSVEAELNTTRYASSDGAVFTLSCVSGGISITGVGAGTAEVEVTHASATVDGTAVITQPTPLTIVANLSVVVA